MRKLVLAACAATLVLTAMPAAVVASTKTSQVAPLNVRLSYDMTGLLAEDITTETAVDMPPVLTPAVLKFFSAQPAALIDLRMLART